MKALRLSRETVLVLGILVLAFALRVFAVNFGLPFLYHADEPIVVNHALAYGTGDLNPHFFNIPPLVSYLLFFCYGLYYALGRGTGLFHSVQDLEQLFYADPSSFYLIARVVFGVLFGTATVYLLYRLVKRFWNAELALWAAFFLAGSFLHARDSHYIYADIPLLLVLVGGFYFIFRLADAPSSWKWHLAAGGMIGLATATKYNGAFLALAYLWICCRTVPWKKWPVWGIAAVAMAILVFVLLNPYAVLDAPYFIQEILEQSRANRGNLTWLHPLRYSLSGAMGIPFLAVALAGWVLALFSRKPKEETLAIFALGYFLVLCKWGQPYDRYVLPLIPFLCVFAAYLIGALKNILSRGSGGSKNAGRAVLFFVSILIAVPSLAKSVLWDQVMAATDVRSMAKTWIEANLPPESRLAMEGSFFMPRLSFSAAQLKEKLASLDHEGAQSKAKKRRVEALLSNARQPSYELYFLSHEPAGEPPLFAGPQIPFDLEALRQQRVDYVLVIEEHHREPDPFMKALRDAAVPVTRFSPYRDPSRTKLHDAQPLTGGPFLWTDIRARERNGYSIAVYKLK